MSIEFYGFLRSDFRGIDSRVLQSFKSLGFTVAIHPGMSFLESNRSGCLFLVFTEIPPQLKRIRPDVPLLVRFEFHISKNPNSGSGWPPRNVKKCAFEVYTRTAAGRCKADLFAQALTVAILAKETNGFFYCDGDYEAISGIAGLDRILKELNNLTDEEFDSGSYAFEAWPPIDSNVDFPRPELIISLKDKSKATISDAKKSRFKLSTPLVFYLAIYLFFFIITIIYQ